MALQTPWRREVHCRTQPTTVNYTHTHLHKMHTVQCAGIQGENSAKNQAERSGYEADRDMFNTRLY